MKKTWVTLPPWIIIGAVFILAPIFIFWTFQNISKQKENSTKLLLEKGAALIRSVEAGTRTGMFGTQWGDSRVQRLLAETSRHPDIKYLMITDETGKILAHSDYDDSEELHGEGLDMEAISQTKTVRWRQIKDSRGDDLFEVYRQFSPMRRPPPQRFRDMMPHDRNHAPMIMREDEASHRLIIFVGLDMETVMAAEKEDIRHTVVMAIILLLIGFAGILSLFMAQGYRSARISLSRIKAFSDNLVEHMPIGLVSVSAEGTITSLNQTAESILRLVVGKTVGQNGLSVLPRQMYEMLTTVKESGGTIGREIDYPLAEGKSIPLDVLATELKDEDGVFLGYVILFKDLTEIDRLRNEIERSRRLASLGRMAAGIAHEIRNPLSSIKGFATYFRERYRDIPEDRKTADIIIGEVDRLNRVIGQLLEFARPMNIQLKPTALQGFLQHSVKMIKQQAGERNITIKTDFPSLIGEIFLDADRMSQVLYNLYLNAFDAMDEGGTLSVGLSSADGGTATITIADTGTGIGAEDMGRIFDPYFTTKPSGTGLGLAIVHRIMEAHNGEIHVDSTPGQGTTISLIFRNQAR
ncbi:MAG TPA: PAS domain-containing protein [Deltaproteobacteria bacterium]|nr:PAS domain-containing protein [Deltaproteobacteria bacterium]